MKSQFFIRLIYKTWCTCSNCVFTTNNSEFTNQTKHITFSFFSWNFIKKVSYIFFRKNNVLVHSSKMIYPVNKTITHSKFRNTISINFSLLVIIHSPKQMLFLHTNKISHNHFHFLLEVKTCNLLSKKLL